MPTNTKATLREEARPDGTHAVRIRVTAARKVTYLHTGLAVTPRQWNPAGTLEKANWVRSSHLDAAELNGKIARYIRELQALDYEVPGLPAADLVALYKRRREGREAREQTAHELLTSYIAREMALIKATVKVRTYERYQRYALRLEAFCAGLPVSGVTLGLVKRLESELLAKNARSTVNKELEFLKAMLKRAVAEGVIEYRDNPFNAYRLPPPRKTHKEKLSEEEIARLEGLTLAPGTNLWHARNTFMLQYCLAGARIGDVLTLKWQDVKESRVSYLEMKGERYGKRHSITITGRLRALLDAYKPEKGPRRYVLPFLEPHAHLETDKAKESEFYKLLESKTSIVNNNLAKLAKLAGIGKKVSTHVSRHSLADKLRRNGDLYAASKLLGHTTLKQTQTYFEELDEEAQDEALRKALEG